MSKLQEAKDVYYGGGNVCDYIKELEKSNGEMRNVLINYMKFINDENHTTGFGLFLITDLIENATGQKIEEVMKNE